MIVPATVTVIILNASHRASDVSLGVLPVALLIGGFVAAFLGMAYLVYTDKI